jgi:hypothetical protein
MRWHQNGSSPNSLQLQSTQTNARQDTAAASKHWKGTVHNKLNGLRLFKLVLKTGQNSESMNSSCGHHPRPFRLLNDFFFSLLLHEMKLLRPLAGYTLYDHKTNNYIRCELQITGILDQRDEYRWKWFQHLQRMPQNWTPLKSYYYRPQGLRNGCYKQSTV